MDGVALCNLVNSCKPLVHHTPKRGYRFRLTIKEVLEGAWLVEGWWVGVALTLLTEFGDPIAGFARIDQLE